MITVNKDKIEDFVSLTRLRNLPFILEIIAGVFLAVNFNLRTLDADKLIFVLLSFQMLYAAIYVNNDILDWKEDLKDEIKSKRPIPSGRIKRWEALIFSLSLTVIALLLAIIFVPYLANFELAFLFFNIFYTLVLKKIPYLEFFGIGTAHAAILYMGVSLFGGIQNYYLIYGFFVFAILRSFFQKYKEIENKQARRTLSFYSLRQIKLTQLFILSTLLLIILFTNSSARIIAIIIFLYALTLVLGYYGSG